MKKLCVIIMSGLLFIGCNSEKQNSEIEKGLTFEDIKSVKNQGFNFDKKNSYSTSIQKDKNSANESALHKGCTAPCCSDK